MAKKKKLSPKHQKWVDARKRFSLSHAHIQMARELGINPKKFGGIANHKQEAWKLPLPQFIESLYFDRFGKRRPDTVRSVEEMARGWNHLYSVLVMVSPDLLSTRCGLVSKEIEKLCFVFFPYGMNQWA